MGIFHQFGSVESFAVKPLLKGTSQVLFVIAGLLFLVGGRAISEFAKIDCVIAEFLGLGLAAVFCLGDDGQECRRRSQWRGLSGAMSVMGMFRQLPDTGLQPSRARWSAIPQVT